MKQRVNLQATIFLNVNKYKELKVQRSSKSGTSVKIYTENYQDTNKDIYLIRDLFTSFVKLQLISQ